MLTTIAVMDCNMNRAKIAIDRRNKGLNSSSFFPKQSKTSASTSLNLCDRILSTSNEEEGIEIEERSFSLFLESLIESLITLITPNSIVFSSLFSSIVLQAQGIGFEPLFEPNYDK